MEYFGRLESFIQMPQSSVELTPLNDLGKTNMSHAASVDNKSGFSIISSNLASSAPATSELIAKSNESTTQSDNQCFQLEGKTSAPLSILTPDPLFQSQPNELRRVIAIQDGLLTAGGATAQAVIPNSQAASSRSQFSPRNGATYTSGNSRDSYGTASANATTNTSNGNSGDSRLNAGSTMEIANSDCVQIKHGSPLDLSVNGGENSKVQLRANVSFARINVRPEVTKRTDVQENRLDSRRVPPINTLAATTGLTPYLQNNETFPNYNYSIKNLNEDTVPMG